MGTEPTTDGRLALPADADPDTEKLFRAFVREGRITAMPARSGRRRRLLDHVAQLFEPGVRYPEPVVNETLLRVYDDQAALRRYLVDEGLLARDNHGVYWRCGGTIRP